MLRHIVPRRGFTLIELIVVTAITGMLFGLLLPTVQKVRGTALMAASTNNLKQLSLACQTHNDTFLRLPYNGGCSTTAERPGINFGWHNPNKLNSGTWITQIAPWIEQEAFFQNNAAIATSTSIMPSYVGANYLVNIPAIRCPGRSRAGFKGTAGQLYSGPVTDYAINTFINAPPTGPFNNIGFAVGSPTVGSNGDWACSQSNKTIQGIQDGSSNTVLLGGKALPPAIGASNNPGLGGDEGIMSPGVWNAPSTRGTTGTGRAHSAGPPPTIIPTTFATTRATQVYPWLFRDTDLSAISPTVTDHPWQVCWGGPFPTKILFAFADGTVRNIPYIQRGTTNLARMLYPNDGGTVIFD